MATIQRAGLQRGDMALWDGVTKTSSRVDATGGTVTGLTVGDYVDVLQVYGSGTDRTSTTISTALARIGTSVNATLLFATGTWTIDSSVTITSNFTCHVPSGCVFSVSSGITLTFACPVIAEGNAAHSSGSGTVVGLDNGGSRGSFYRRTSAEETAAVTPKNYQYEPEGNGPADVRRYGAAVDGTTDDTTALTNALSANRRVTWRGTLKVTSQITLADQRRIEGAGCTSDNTARGATCLLRAFTGSNPTILASGDDAGLDGLDIDNDDQGTGVCLQVTGTRFTIGAVSTRKSGGDGVRIGSTEAGASSINANAGKIDHLITLDNAGNGILWDHTNTDTTAAFPVGVPDCNAWSANNIDARSNGGDGIKLANTIDNTFMNAVAQSNTGYGVHLAQYARGHVFLKPYTEGNTGTSPSNNGELILDSGADNNIVIGSRAGLTTPLWTDNGAGNWIISYNDQIENDEFVLGKSINLQNIAANGHVYFRGYADALAALSAYLDIYQAGTSGGVLDIYTKRDGDTPVRRLQLDQLGNVVVNNAAIATNATDGFLYVPSCAGTPNGTPTTKTGMIPIVVDSTNHKLYFYSGGSWRDAGP